MSLEKRGKYNMRVEGYKRLENGIIIKTTRGQVKIEIYDNNIFRIVYTLNEEFSKKDSLMVLPQKAKNAKWDIEETNKVIVLSTEIIKLSIDKETGAFTPARSPDPTASRSRTAGRPRSFAPQPRARGRRERAPANLPRPQARRGALERATCGSPSFSLCSAYR